MIIHDGTHLVSTESEEELHAFAQALGLKREWYQNHPIHPHYDLTTFQAMLRATDQGAVRVTPVELLQLAWWSTAKDAQITRLKAAVAILRHALELMWRKPTTDELFYRDQDGYLLGDGSNKLVWVEQLQAHVTQAQLDAKICALEKMGDTEFLDVFRKCVQALEYYSDPNYWNDTQPETVQARQALILAERLGIIPRKSKYG